MLLSGLVTGGTFDRATAYAMAARVWTTVAGLLTVAVVSWSFSPEIQGYYFTFMSILTFQTVVELGLGSVIQQFASHEWAHIHQDSPGQVEGGTQARQRLGSLARFGFRWYGAAGLALIVGLGLGGHFYFFKTTDAVTGDPVSWQAAWWVACFVTGLTLLLTPALSILEGCNRVSDVYGLQLAQAVASRGLLWVVMATGGGLWALPVSRAAAWLAGIGFLGRRYRVFFRNILRERAEEQLDWRREIWPLQWRFAVSWLGGYALFSLFTPVLFAFHGAVVAGQMGMTLSVVGALSSVCYAVVGTRIPQFAIAAARKEYDRLDRLFRRATATAVAMAGGGALTAWCGLFILNRLESPLAVRFLPLDEAGFLLLAVILQQVRFAMGGYLRAHKKEPFMILAVVEGLAAVGGLSLLGVWYGSRGMTTGFLVLSAILLVPAMVIFQRSRSEWHRVASVPLGTSVLVGEKAR